MRPASRVINTGPVMDRRRPVKADADIDVQAHDRLGPGAIQACGVGLHRATAEESCPRVVPRLLNHGFETSQPDQCRFPAMQHQ